MEVEMYGIGVHDVKFTKEPINSLKKKTKSPHCVYNCTLSSKSQVLRRLQDQRLPCVWERESWKPGKVERKQQWPEDN